ncbi:serine protease 53-like [Schistocerca americana]|uniref:serine protease 53-like n=1 Tax=Schistocerca americana TaxID=7009 RepID=UPI001F4F8E1B|nr:serine protease 53-like [Schistocerca americana]
MAGRVVYLLVSAMLVAVANASVIKRGTVAPPEERDVRIVDGNQAGVGQFPHQASVIADGTSVCAGSLVTSAAVLTTAHCTEGRKTWSIRLGGIHPTAAETTAWIVESSSAAVHP